MNTIYSTSKHAIVHFFTETAVDGGSLVPYPALGGSYVTTSVSRATQPGSYVTSKKSQVDRPGSYVSTLTPRTSSPGSYVYTEPRL